MQKLNQLNLITLPLHAAHDMNIILNNLRSSMNALIAVEHIGILLPEEENDDFILHLFDTAADKTEGESIPLSRAEILHAYKETGGQPLLNNDSQDEEVWPFAEKLQGIKLEQTPAGLDADQKSTSTAPL